jgi:Uma2 family endonuclease
VPARAKTHAGFREWLIEEWGDRPGRICYLDGDLFIDMSPDEIETHNKIKTEISSALVVLNKRLKRGTFFSDGTLVTNRKAHLSTVPDGTFVLWETRQSGRVKLKERKRYPGEFVELIGSPDWVLEIVSRTSLSKDTQNLPPLYHKAEISEYWLVSALSGEIDFQVFRWREDGYRRAAAKDGWQRSVVFGCWFRLTRRKDRLGEWEYTLELRE